jgi:hypothetical protein
VKLGIFIITFTFYKIGGRKSFIPVVVGPYFLLLENNELLFKDFLGVNACIFCYFGLDLIFM